MINPMSVIKNVTEVEVQFKDEDPTWIPMDTLLSMMEWELEVKGV